MAELVPSGGSNQNRLGWLLAGCVVLLLACVGCSLLSVGAYVLWPKGTMPVVIQAPAPIVVQPQTGVQPPVQQGQPSLNTEGFRGPTTAEVKRLTGVDVQRIGTEAAAWVWRGVPGATVRATCPRGYVCTWDVPGDIVVVHLGVDQSAVIRAGTWRKIDAYPPGDAVYDVCSLYQKEKGFGVNENPSFQVRFVAVKDGSGALVGPQSCP